MREAALLLAISLASCGYHVAGKTNLLPKNVQSIAIPAFGNVSTQYKVADLLAAALTREFISRTRYRITADPNTADAVLSGAVANYFYYPTVADPVTGRGTGAQVVVILQISLRDRATGALLFNRPSMEFRERYEISIDPKAYFDESEAAMQRLSRDVARSVVSAILENF